MIPVFQTIVDKDNGDCMRACIASLLEFDINQVPNFTLFKPEFQNYIFTTYMYILGWNYTGFMKYQTNDISELLKEDSINRFFYTSVKSKLYKDRWHAVIMDMNGIIVHDPNPSKLYLNENVFETGNIIGWHRFSYRNDAYWRSIKGKP